MIFGVIILVPVINIVFCQPQVQIFNQINARLQCEYKDNDGDSLILNCTLTNGFVNGQESGFLLNADSTQSSPIQSLNLRIGLETNWRTPWESLSINPNIIRTLIWQNSKLSEMGQYSFKDLKYLQRIDLSLNKLTNLRSYVFSYLEIDVIELDLSNNYFQTIPQDIFENSRLQNLEIFKMNENPIMHISSHSFEKIQNNIKMIELNYCKIRTIDSNTFSKMRQLDSLSLIGNHLRSLNYNNFKNLNLRSFYIHENPLNCDCNLRWIIDYIKNIDYQQQIYETPVLTSKSKLNYLPKMSVASAAQHLLKCDQPNSLKSKQNFLNINPDSFMCDIQIHFRDEINEANYEIGDDALLICDVYGDPEPEVYWSYGQKPIGKGLQNVDEKYYVNEVRLIPNPRNTNMYSVTNKTSELRVKQLQPNDFGTYTCTAEIKGSNNRKIIGFNVKQVNRKNIALSSATEFFNSIFYKILSHLKLNESKDAAFISKPAIIISLRIITIIILFMLIFCTITIWKCCLKNKSKRNKKLIYNINGTNKEKEMVHLIDNSDALDAHSSNLMQQNLSNLANDSSATFLSSNKISNSIRMAYPNINEIYANHSLLTTTSTTTGSTYPTNHIAIDTSGQNPKYHFLAHQNIETYYDDLKFNCEDSPQTNNGSPYRTQNSNSPIIRRDDPTVPLYATLKPKMSNPQHQRQYSSNYLQYSTIQRSTPPLPIPRRINNYSSIQIQLPPPPPPPVIPPMKPKRTFEYSKELQLDNGPYLLNEETNEPSECDINYQTYKRIKRKPAKANSKTKDHNPVPNSSTTSLDEEDLDLNDLKDFEDVTFDNLRKPNEHDQNSGNRLKQHLAVKKSQFILLQQGLKKNLLDHGQMSTNSEQSLLLKSSSSSSDKSSSNTALNPNNDSPNTERISECEKNKNSLDKNPKTNDQIYEETEI